MHSRPSLLGLFTCIQLSKQTCCWPLNTLLFFRNMCGTQLWLKSHFVLSGRSSCLSSIQYVSLIISQCSFEMCYYQLMFSVRSTADSRAIYVEFLQSVVFLLYLYSIFISYSAVFCINPCWAVSYLLHVIYSISQCYSWHQWMNSIYQGHLSSNPAL